MKGGNKPKKGRNGCPLVPGTLHGYVPVCTDVLSGVGVKIGACDYGLIAPASMTESRRQ